MTANNGVEFDMTAPEQLANPMAYLAQMRATCPVYRDEATDSFFLTRLEDVKAAAVQPNVFSSHRPVFGTGDPELEAIMARGYRQPSTLTTNDPPVHTRYRKLVNRAFAPKAVQALEPAIRTIVNELVDRFIDRGEVEFVSEFSYLLPGYVIADALGVAREDQPQFVTWSEDIVATIQYAHGLSRERQIECAESFVAFQHYFAAEIDKRRVDRERHDMLSDLVFAEVAGERPLDVEEILEIARTLLIAGNETTAAWIENTMILLLDNPDVLATIQADRSKLVNALEESLRISSPARWVMRTMEAEGIEVDGVQIPEGCRVRLSFMSANHDESRYADPLRFDPDRDVADNVAFGHGIHYCIGAHLARAEARIAYEVLLDRLTDFQLAAPREDVRFLPVPGIGRLNHLPMTFRKR